MGFGGGGSAGITAHKHSAASSEGGTLNTTTLINGAPLFTLMVVL